MNFVYFSKKFQIFFKNVSNFLQIFHNFRCYTVMSSVRIPVALSIKTFARKIQRSPICLAVKGCFRLVAQFPKIRIGTFWKSILIFAEQIPFIICNGFYNWSIQVSIFLFPGLFSGKKRWNRRGSRLQSQKRDPWLYKCNKNEQLQLFIVII